MLAAGIPCRASGIQAVFITVFRRDDTVGGHQDGSVEAFKFFLLLPPCISIVAYKVGIFLKGRIIVGRQHLRMGIVINPSPFRLLKQHLQVSKVMAGYQDCGSGTNADIYLGHLWVSIGRRVGLIQKRHAAHPVFPGFQRKRHQLLYAQPVVLRLSQGALEKCVQLLILFKKGIGMLAVGRKPL